MSKVKIVKKLTDKGFPYHEPKYREAHNEADAKEKKRFPKGYEKLKKLEKGLNKNELMGKNTRSGKIQVEKRFKKEKKEIAFHERTENKNIKRMERKSHKSHK